MEVNVFLKGSETWPLPRVEYIDTQAAFVDTYYEKTSLKDYFQVTLSFLSILAF